MSQESKGEEASSSSQMINKITILQWNIQGLRQDFLIERTVAVVDLVKSLKPTAIMFQELIVPSYSYLKSSLKPDYFSCSPLELMKDRVPSYFTAIFVCRSQVAEPRANIMSFISSTQGRDLLSMKGKINGLDISLMTSHLESMKTREEERKCQLAAVYAEMMKLPINHSVIFAGDTNLKDYEFWSVVKSGKFDVSKVNDVWVMLGSPEDARYSWDLQRNDNQVEDGKARLRYDRLYTRIGDQGGKYFRPLSVKFVGTDRLPCGMFPSDHWGLLVEFSV